MITSILIVLLFSFLIVAVSLEDENRNLKADREFYESMYRGTFKRYSQLVKDYHNLMTAKTLADNQLFELTVKNKKKSIIKEGSKLVQNRRNEPSHPLKRKNK